ncbi:cytochrome P450 [Kribbella sp. NBC_00709]|uniref:cytochrome P450 n=1 Tax=Kribbella sp. NBC_00709 TaxID=2975972 RepID=UPI002E2E66F6|nr:cytochrome P450 [Kribbella sp. NBC_00709]
MTGDGGLPHEGRTAGVWSRRQGRGEVIETVDTSEAETEQVIAAPAAVLGQWSKQPQLGVRVLTGGRFVVTDPRLARTVLKSTTEPLRAESAPFGEIPGWVPGSAPGRPATVAMAAAIESAVQATSPDRMDELLTEVLAGATPWPAAAGELCLRLVVPQVLPNTGEQLIARYTRSLAALAGQAHDRSRVTRWKSRLAHSRTLSGLYGELSRIGPGHELVDALRAVLGSEDEVTLAVDGMIGAACRAMSGALSWSLLLRAGWTPQTPAGTVLQVPPVPAGDPVREALRLWPPAWLLHRDVRQPVEIGDRKAEPGDHVFICTYLMHRRPEIWADPDSYRPERWIDPPERYRDAYLPFGVGAAACVGAGFVTDLSARFHALGGLVGAEVRMIGTTPVMGPLCDPPQFVVSPG